MAEKQYERETVKDCKVSFTKQRNYIRLSLEAYSFKTICLNESCGVGDRRDKELKYKEEKKEIRERN